MTEFFVGLLFTLAFIAGCYAIGWTAVRYWIGIKGNKQHGLTVLFGLVLLMIFCLVISLMVGIGTTILGGPS